MKRVFVTGTDTEVGKTVIGCSIAHKLVAAGKQCSVFKPVAAGAYVIDGGLKNSDAILLQQHSNMNQPYDEVNPICFEHHVAPHIAADDLNQPIDLHALIAASAKAAKGDVQLIEGAGGWMVPLNDHATLADLATQVCDGVVLVVGIRLGCINHALLTAHAVEAAGLPLLGWIANCVDRQALVVEDNIAAIKKRIAAPCLGVVPFQQEPVIAEVASHLNIGFLID